MADGMERALAARRKKLAVSLGLVIGLPALGIGGYGLVMTLPQLLERSETAEVVVEENVPQPTVQPIEVPLPVEPEEVQAEVSPPERPVIAAQPEPIAPLPQSDSEPAPATPGTADLLEEAQKAIAEDNPVRALANINSVLQLEPSNAQALALKAETETLQRVLDLLDQVGKAEAEQNRSALVALLSEINELDPTREGIRQRLDQLRQEEIDRRFSAAINQALSAVDAGNLEEAVRAADVAQRLAPNRQELALASQRINQLREERDLASIQAAALDLVLEEDWKQAEEVYKVGLSRHPGDRELMEGIALARSINGASAELQEYLDRPYRLSDPAVARRAREAVTRAEPVLAQSGELMRQRDQLLETIDQMSTPMGVQVKSDGLTEVTVRGVGQVGRVEERVISLKPGRYLFEGYRQGYRDVLVEVTLDPNQPSPIVTVIANEPL